VKNGKVSKYKITSTGKLIDDALEAVEKENPKLKNVLNKNYTQLQIDPSNLAGLIDLIGVLILRRGREATAPHPNPLPVGEGARKARRMNSLSPRERAGVRENITGSTPGIF
jgi:hypothetical protein